MDDNLTVWNRFADIDPEFTKPITGKPYKGTSPNPQYVIRCLTELFGPVGLGFGWDVLAEDFTPLDEEVLHWCRIKFWHTDRTNTFDSYGQTKAVMKTRNGLMVDEDAPKKSLTDAIIKASSHLGIAANIFLGRWDDQKYVEGVNRSFRDEEKPPRDPKAVAESLIKLIAKQTTTGGLDQLNSEGTKFFAALDWLAIETPDIAAQVNNAWTDRYGALDGADLGSDDIPESMK